MLNIQTNYGTYAIHHLVDLKSANKTLVCLHGFMGSFKTFEFLKKQTDYNVIAIDLIGHSFSEQSSNKEDYQLKHIAESLEQIFDKLNLDEFYLLGYSYGGRVAMTYAYSYPNRVKHLILESASFGLSTEEERNGRHLNDQKQADSLAKLGMKEFVLKWQKSSLFSSQKLLDTSIYEKEIHQKINQNPICMSLSLLESSVAHQPNYLETSLFDMIPITYISGKLDVKYTEIGQKSAIIKQFDFITIEEAGHCVHLEKPELVMDIIFAILFKKIIEIKSIKAYEYELDLVSPFKTSYGEINQKKADIFIVETTNLITGYGELVSFETPDYIEETLQNDRYIIKEHLAPLLKNKKLYSPRQVRDLFMPIKGNQMAKSAIETAIWDVFAKDKGVSLNEYLDISKQPISVGVSIGIQESEEKLVKTVSSYIEQGYTRVKLKVSKGQDIEYIKAIRTAFPDLNLMVDANSAYHLSDVDYLKQFDSYQLAMIEQPLDSSDFYEHSLLQKQIKTSICLDENIRSLDDVKLAVHLGSCQGINLKIPRVGGLTEALDILNYAKKKQLIIWLGGMLESGVGRSLNLMLANHSAFNFPGDLSASNRYYQEDVIEETFTLNNGQIMPLSNTGIGIRLKNNNKKIINYL